MNNFTNYGYINPLQTRIDSLNQQKQMIDNQLQSLQQMSAVPPININNNMGPSIPSGTYDFNGKWVDNEEQAKQVANNNLPLILFDNNDNIFYMKGMDGSFKKFKFEEVVETPTAIPLDTQTNARIESLESKLNSLIEALQGTNSQTISNIPIQEETLLETSKNDTKRGSKGGKPNG